MTTILSGKTFAGRSGESSRGLLTPRSVITATALSLAVGGAVNTYAQEGKSVALEEIIVTATRREEGLQTIPASISAVTAADMDKKGISGFQQLSESIAGLQMSKPTNSISTGIYVRGVGTGGTSPADSSVGLLVDNVYQLRQGAVFSELLDIERVEVLRGPQGTLFGKNTTAGVIRIFTADPDTSELSGRVQAVGGSLDNREVRGLINVPLIEDSMALRASAYTAERDGYTKNLYADEDTRNVDRQGWRAKFLWDITDTVQVKLTGEQGEQSSDIDAAMPAYSASMLAASPTLATLYPIGLGKSQHSHEETTDDVERYGANLKWEIAGHTLTTTSSWDDIELFLLQDRDRTKLNQQVLTNLGHTEVETHEIQWNSNFDGMFNYVLGYYNQKEELSSLTYIYLGIPTESYRTTTPFRTSLTLKDQSSEAYFGTAFMEFSDQWKATLGVRYTDDIKDSVPTDLWAGGDTSFDEWTYSAKLTYQMDPDVMLYVSHDKGFKSGGINRSSNGACGTVVTGCTALWDPETTFNYELGMKSEWLDNTLRLNGALYYQTYEDFQVTQNIVTFQTVLVRNAAEAESRGIEGDFVFLATDNLTFDGGVALNFAEYKDFKNATCLSGTPNCVGGFKDLSGETLDHAPELTFNLGTEYRQGLDILNGAEGFARLDWVYRDDQQLYFEQYAITEQEAYSLLNARIGVEVADSWKVTAWVNNLADEEYLADALLDATSAQLVPGIERTYGVTLDWYF